MGGYISEQSRVWGVSRRLARLQTMTIIYHVSTSSNSVAFKYRWKTKAGHNVDVRHTKSEGTKIKYSFLR